MMPVTLIDIFTQKHQPVQIYISLSSFVLLINYWKFLYI